MHPSRSALLAPWVLIGAAGLAASAEATAAADSPAGETGVAYDAYTEVELISERAGIEPGSELLVGLRMKPEPNWHTYWKNPGGSGEAPRLSWHLPAGLRANEPRFPAPELHAYEVIQTHNYGYSREFILPVTLEVPAQIDEDSVRLVLEARWLTCDPRQCIPGEATLALELPVAEAEWEPSEWASFFAAIEEELPEPPDFERVVLAAEGGAPILHLSAPGEGELKDAYFFPEPRNLFDYGAEQPIFETDFGHALELPLVPSASVDDLPEALRGVLTFERGGETYAWQIEHPLVEPPAAIAATGPPGPAEAADGLRGLLVAIGFAFLGGMLLNLMPCVFPILSLKVLSLVKSQGSSRRHTRLHGLSYGAGVMVSFWVLAALLIAIRGAGEQLSWGFHLQSPTFIALMALLVFAIALNLAGLYEIGTGLVNLAGRADQRIGGEGSLGGSFGTGVLATTLATPCTAPLMGPALGFALAQPSSVILQVLTALGLGMALPYVLLYWIPAVGRAMPRPGAWMDTLKQALAFPMFAVAIWLVWVFGNQVEHASAVLMILSAMLALALALWIYGRWATPARSTRVRWIGRGVAAVIAALAIALPVLVVAGARAAESLPWEAYRDEAVAEIREAEGRMVFVNFTADWCVNCQLLEQTVLASRRVGQVFSEHDVALLKADWTNHDSHITEALGRFERRSIPFFVLYPADPEAEPVELGEWITRGQVERAVVEAAALAPSESD